MPFKKTSILTPLVTLLISFALAGCSSMGLEPEKIEIKDPGPKSQIFYFPYQEVWKSALLTLGKYPLKSYDDASGVIETDYISGDKIWIPPHKDKYIPGGYRYKINLRVIQGTYNSQNVVRVIVLKQIERQKDFFSESEKLQTDGLEESAILYRIERELSIDKALSKKKN